MKKFLIAIGISFLSQASRAQEEVSLPTFKLPSLTGHPPFLAQWKQEILTRSTTSEMTFKIDSEPFERLSDESLPLPEEFINQSGSLLYLTLESTQGNKDLKDWTRLIRNLHTILANNTPAPNFNRSLKLKEAILNPPLAPNNLADNGFVKIDFHKNPSPWESDLCKRIIPWVHTVQLLSGRTEISENARKEPYSLVCRLRHYAELSHIPFYIQIMEMPLPYLDPRNKRALLSQPSDLTSLSVLQKLQALQSSSPETSQ